MRIINRRVKFVEHKRNADCESVRLIFYKTLIAQTKFWHLVTLTLKNESLGSKRD